MANLIGSYVDNATLNFWWGGVPLVPITNYYVALFTTMPDANNEAGVECSGSGYVRKMIPNNLTYWPETINGIKSNGQIIEFVPATGSWGTILGYGIYTSNDPLTNHLVNSGTFNEPIPITTNQILRIPAGSLIVRRPQ